MVTINDVRDAYEGATGQWTGCNWLTHYGSLDLDLDGVSSNQAQRASGRWRTIAADKLDCDEITGEEEAFLVDMALQRRLRVAVFWRGEDQVCRLKVARKPARRFCAEILASQWTFAAYWLEEIELDARWAEEEAQEAVRAAEEGDWKHALGHARQACVLESGYDDPRSWRHLKQVIEEAAR
jgi:hypothetical protein